MSIESPEGNYTTADNTVEEETDEMSKAEVNKKLNSTEVDGKGVAGEKLKKKDKKDGVKGEKSKESTAVGNTNKCLELATIIQS